MKLSMRYSQRKVSVDENILHLTNRLIPFHRPRTAALRIYIVSRYVCVFFFSFLYNVHI